MRSNTAESADSLVRGRGTDETSAARANHTSETDCGCDKSPSMKVVEAVADAEGVSPMEVDSPLYDAINPDALDALFETAGDSTGGEVRFTLSGYRIRVTMENEVDVAVSCEE